MVSLKTASKMNAFLQAVITKPIPVDLLMSDDLENLDDVFSDPIYDEIHDKSAEKSDEPVQDQLGYLMKMGSQELCSELDAAWKRLQKMLNAGTAENMADESGELLVDEPTLNDMPDEDAKPIVQNRTILVQHFNANFKEAFVPQILTVYSHAGALKSLFTLYEGVHTLKSLTARVEGEEPCNAYELAEMVAGGDINSEESIEIDGQELRGLLEANEAPDATETPDETSELNESAVEDELGEVETAEAEEVVEEPVAEVEPAVETKSNEPILYQETLEEGAIELLPENGWLITRAGALVDFFGFYPDKMKLPEMEAMNTDAELVNAMEAAQLVQFEDIPEDAQLCLDIIQIQGLFNNTLTGFRRDLCPFPACLEASAEDEQGAPADSEHLPNQEQLPDPVEPEITPTLNKLYTVTEFNEDTMDSVPEEAQALELPAGELKQIFGLNPECMKLPDLMVRRASGDIENAMEVAQLIEFDDIPAEEVVRLDLIQLRGLLNHEATEFTDHEITTPEIVTEEIKSPQPESNERTEPTASAEAGNADDLDLDSLLSGFDEDTAASADSKSAAMKTPEPQTDSDDEPDDLHALLAQLDDEEDTTAHTELDQETSADTDFSMAGLMAEFEEIEDKKKSAEADESVEENEVEEDSDEEAFAFDFNDLKWDQ